MVTEANEVFQLLQHLRLFVGLDDAQLELVAASTEVVELVEGQFLKLPANKDHAFFLIRQGKVRHIHQLSDGKLELSTLKKEDFFGAEVLLTGKRRVYRIEALQKTILLKIDPNQLDLLLASLPLLESNIQNQLKIYRLVRRKIFRWLGEDETVHLILRRHTAYIILSLLTPLIIAWTALFAFLILITLDISSSEQALQWASLAIGIAAVLWVLWKGLDLLNDYYIVTDRRVVFLHRILLLYESREEAPLTAIKSEEVTTSLLGRLLGYGNVVTYAFMGKVTFKNIADPNAIRELIEGLRKRTKAGRMEADRQTMESLIRRKIDLASGSAETPEEQDKAEVSQNQESSGDPVQRQGGVSEHRGHDQGVPFLIWLQQCFQTYFNVGGVITYRKHILILVKKTWLPAVVMMLILVTAIYIFFRYTFGDWSGPPLLPILLVAGLALSPFLLWWLYQYMDWRNDIYQITDDKIIDTEKRPLGTEITKSAPLDNILSLDYELIGFWGVLFNLGNVIINTGTDKLTWDTIANPARAQREIFNRMFEQRRSRQVNEARKEWERMSDWLAAYHHQAEEIRRTENLPPH